MLESFGSVLKSRKQFGIDREIRKEATGMAGGSTQHFSAAYLVQRSSRDVPFAFKMCFLYLKRNLV